MKNPIPGPTACTPPGCSADELSQWVSLSPTGLLVFDDAGQVVQSNPAFEALVGHVPAALSEAAADLQALLGWRGGAPRADLLPGAPIVMTQATLQQPDGRPLHLQARLRAYATAAGQRRIMVFVEDRGAEYERDPAPLEIGAMSALTDASAAELAGLDIGMLLEDRAAALAFDGEGRRALRQHGRDTGTLRLRRRDGASCGVQVAMRAVDPADPQAGTIASCVDVDDRQRAHESLQAQVARTRAVLDSVLVGIVTVGEGGIEWMNRSARRMFAGELSDFAGKPMGSVATDDAGHPLHRRDWLERLRDGQAETFECRLRARDGREFWVVGNAVATLHDSAVGRQLTFALLDIEARRQAEVSIASAQASLQRVIETAPLAIALFDAGTQQVLQMNQMAASFFGGTLERLLGQRPVDWTGGFGHDEVAALQASLQLAIDTPDGVRREIARPGAGGAEARRWDARFVMLDPADGAGGTGGQVLLVASDVTEQRAAEQARLDAAIAQREMLVKEVHHRIKNNLQGVAGLLQQASARHPGVAPILAEAVGQVQAIAQVYGLQVGAGGPLQVAGVLTAIAGSVQRNFGHAIAVQMDGDGPLRWLLPEVESIPVALLLNELLMNAVRHGAGSPVSCRLTENADGVLIEIANAGRLREGVAVATMPGGTYGLGLVRALLPRRSASLVLEQHGEQVVARVALRAPSVLRGDGTT